MTFEIAKWKIDKDIQLHLVEEHFLTYLLLLLTSSVLGIEGCKRLNERLISCSHLGKRAMANFVKQMFRFPKRPRDLLF